MKLAMKKPGRIRAAVLSWLGVPVGLLSDDFWKYVGGGQKSGQTVNERTVLNLSAAYACTRLLSEVVASLPIHVYERMPDGRRAAPEHPLNGIIHVKPNADSTAMTFWESTMASILLRGTGFAERLEIGGRLVGLQFLHPDKLSIQPTAGTAYKFFYTERGKRREIPERRIFYIPGFSTNGRWGCSVIAHGAAAFGNALAADAAAGSTFERGLMPTVALKFPKVLKPDQRKEARETLEALSGAVNSGKPVILEAETDAVQIGIKPSDAQLLEARGFSVEDICRFFGVDPSLVGHGQKVSNWGTGLEQKMLGFLAFSLRPWLVRIQQAINTQLLSPVDQLRYYAEFSIEGLLQADSAARSAFFSIMVDKGIMTRDEVRRKENLPPMGGNASVLTVQSNMAPLDSLGTQPEGETIRNALASWLSVGSTTSATSASSEE